MSGYVGTDVHRKRSRVAVVTEDGTVELNKNVVNGSEPMLRGCQAARRALVGGPSTGYELAEAIRSCPLVSVAVSGDCYCWLLGSPPMRIVVWLAAVSSAA